VIVSPAADFDKDALATRAAALQERHSFRFPLQQVLSRRMAKPMAEAAGGELITDDFAPVNLYDTIGKQPRRGK
jgi:hypothetical protein